MPEVSADLAQRPCGPGQGSPAPGHPCRAAIRPDSRIVETQGGARARHQPGARPGGAAGPGGAGRRRDPALPGCPRPPPGHPASCWRPMRSDPSWRSLGARLAIPRMTDADLARAGGAARGDAARRRCRGPPRGRDPRRGVPRTPAGHWPETAPWSACGARWSPSRGPTSRSSRRVRTPTGPRISTRGSWRPCGREIRRPWLPRCGTTSTRPPPTSPPAGSRSRPPRVAGRAPPRDGVAPPGATEPLLRRDRGSRAPAPRPAKATARTGPAARRSGLTGCRCPGARSG